ELAMRMGFEDTRDSFYGSFETLTENREKAVELLALALNKPRFDAGAVERVRGQLLAGLAAAARDPDRVASEQWAAMAFPGHPYGRPANGTVQSVRQIAGADLRDYWGKNFARDTLRVVAVGDIDAAALAKTLDVLFGAMPAKAQLVPVPPTQPQAA